jgi:hypothetical protein
MKRFLIMKFLDENNVDYKTSGHKHCAKGWVQVKCPFCTGNPGWHLGINIESGTWLNCRRCGKRNLWEWLKTVVNPSPAFLSETVRRYSTGSGLGLHPKVKALHKEILKMPPGIVEGIPKRAFNYLYGRGYDPSDIARIWGLKFTGPSGSHKFRIIAPIYFQGQMVSYQGRDYTGKADLRYKACKKENEVKDHQDCLYGSWMIHNKRAVVVEGIADVWRLGPGAVGTFGISYTKAQLRELASYEFLALLFDGEEQATAGRDQLAFELKSLNPRLELQTIDLEGGDPGELSQDDADHLMRDILGKSRR